MTRILAFLVTMLFISFVGTAVASINYTAADGLSGSTTSRYSGTVIRIKNDKEFLLRSDRGMISVHMDYAKPPVLDEGDSITVTGTLSTSQTGKQFDASSVDLHQRAGI